MNRFAALLSLVLLPFPAFSYDWSYEGVLDHQDNWGSIAPEYKLCAEGNEQSPITISHTESTDLPQLKFDYTKSLTRIKKERYTLIVTPEKQMTLVDNNVTYLLKYMEIHTPGEHRVGDTYYPIELQLVHEGPDKKQLILSIFVELGVASAALKPLVINLPVATQTTSALIDWNLLLPVRPNYYAYDGSITHPPCTEGVARRVLKTPVQASDDQIGAIARLLGRNARSQQPVMMRTIKDSGE